MPRWVRFMLIGLALLVAAGAGGWLWVRSSLPQIDGVIRLSGLAEPVSVMRDAVGIPHIIGKSRQDTAFALGFVHAQDRLWQMEFNRRLGAGRLAEILGADALAMDRLMRIYGFYRLAQADVSTLDAATRAELEAYAAGVNAYLTSRRGALPPEFLLLGVRPEPWRPADSLVWLKLMALDMGYMWRRDLERLQLAGRLTPRQIALLLDKTTGPPADMADVRALLPGLPRSTFAIPQGADGSGSNNWVLAGSRTKSGKPLLANDPHLAYSQPSVWYMAHLAADGRNTVGVTFPGLPFVILGRNDAMAWGFTNVAPDVHDLIVERIDRKTGTYATPDGPARLTRRSEIIQVKGAAPVKLEVLSTRNGPLLSDAWPDVARALGPGHGLAIKWTMLAPADRTVQAARGIALAQTPEAFLAALRDFRGPMQNVVWAHVGGAIGYITPGDLPRRAADFPGRGMTPAPGWIAATRWEGMIPFDALTQQRDPQEGFIATANNRITSRAWPDHVTFDWEGSFRHDSIVRNIAALDKHDRESMRGIQADSVDAALGEAARRLAARVADDPLGRSLAAWNGVMSPSALKPLLADAWVSAFSRRLLADEAGPGIRPAVVNSNMAMVLRVLRGEAGSAAWCDDVRTRPAESCDALARAALSDAIAHLTRQFGADRSQWRWGARNIARFAHHPFTKAGFLRDTFDRTVVVPGGPDSINVALRERDGTGSGPVYLGPSFRAIYDLSDLDASRFMIPTGQSGNPLSPWYDNLSEPWSRGVQLVITTDRKAIASRLPHHLRLEPAGN